MFFNNWRSIVKFHCCEGGFRRLRFTAVIAGFAGMAPPPDGNGLDIVRLGTVPAVAEKSSCRKNGLLLSESWRMPIYAGIVLKYQPYPPRTTVLLSANGRYAN